MNHELDPYLTSYSCLPLSTVERMLALKAVILQAVQDGTHKAVEADLRIRALQRSVELIKQREERARQAKVLRQLEEKRWG
jgi:hypothetical protein